MLVVLLLHDVKSIMVVVCACNYDCPDIVAFRWTLGMLGNQVVN